MRYLVFSVCVLLAFSCGRDTASKEEALVVTGSAAERFKQEPLQEFAFIAKPYSSVNLSFRVGGPLSGEILMPGKFYKKGEVITTIDPRDFLVRKERAEALYAQAKAEFERVDVLYKKNNVSASAYDKAKAECANAKAAFETASNELKDTRLVAPFSGYIGEVFVERFQDVRPVQPIMNFVELDKLKIEVYVPQSVASGASGVKQVGLKFDLIPDKVYQAKITGITKSTLSNNISYLLTAELENPKQQELLAGMSGKMQLELPSDANVERVVIPQTALAHRPETGAYVWVIGEDNTVSQRQVQLGDLASDGKIIIREGLREGEQVATCSLRFLSEGTKIQVK